LDWARSATGERRSSGCAGLAGRIALTALLVSAVCLGPVGLGLAQDSASPKKLNPYTGKEEAIKAGRTLFLQYGCSGCHGVGGGGGMGPPLIKDNGGTWKFGSSDEVLFKLIRGEIPQQTMPKVFGQLPDEEVWKIIAYVRSLYGGDPSAINW
jgi:mono/diheme cytochrome c family protein